MTAEDKVLAVLHIQAKCVRAGNLTSDAEGRKVYFVTSEDARMIKSLGVLRFDMPSGERLELVLRKGQEAILRSLSTGWWDDFSLADRVTLAKKAGLDGRDGARAWKSFTPEQQVMLEHLKDGNQSRPETASPEPAAKPAPTRAPTVQDKGSKPTGAPKPAPKPMPKPAEPKPVVAPAKQGQTDLVMWVGTNHYPTVQDFIDEAKSMGVSKRIGRLPHCLVPGVTRLFFAHDEGFIGEGFIFAYCIIETVEILTANLDDLPETFEDRMVPVLISECRKERERGCGWRLDEGAIYLKASKLILLKPPRSFEVYLEREAVHYRGALQTTKGDAIIAGRIPDGFITPPSQLFKANEAFEWTPASDKALLVAVKKAGDTPLQQVFTRFAFSHGIQRSVVNYRYGQLTAKPKSPKGGESK